MSGVLKPANVGCLQTGLLKHGWGRISERQARMLRLQRSILLKKFGPVGAFCQVSPDLANALTQPGRTIFPVR